MTIKIFNTINRKKEELVTVKKDSVTMYVCGPTVYSHPHIGNARASIVPDILYRLLKVKYSHVTYIRNITDVDDKISETAKKLNKSVYEVADKYIKIYRDNMSSLGILSPTHEPRVTDNITAIINAIQKIINNGFGYISDDHVIFDTVKYEAYGKLSKRTLQEMIDGVRIDIADYKKSPRDFILWKPSNKDQPGWDSPWGLGRPGWHIECTSMIKNIIGDDSTLDIHGGGNDLIFPHHENEIAQGSCMSKSTYCNYWFHNGIVLVDKKKMSKSLGNVILVDNLLKNYSPSVIRLALLSAHYRQPLNWLDSTLIESQNLIKKFSDIIKTRDPKEDNPAPKEIIDILSDDLNTPQAIKHLSLLAKHAKKNNNDLDLFHNSLNFIGLDLIESRNKQLPSNLDINLVKNLVKERLIARKSGDFAKADEIRDKLSILNIKIKDLKDETTWDYNPD